MVLFLCLSVYPLEDRPASPAIKTFFRYLMTSQIAEQDKFLSASSLPVILMHSFRPLCLQQEGIPPALSFDPHFPPLGVVTPQVTGKMQAERFTEEDFPLTPSSSTWLLISKAFNDILPFHLLSFSTFLSRVYEAKLLVFKTWDQFFRDLDNFRVVLNSVLTACPAFFFTNTRLQQRQECNIKKRFYLASFNYS